MKKQKIIIVRRFGLTPVTQCPSCNSLCQKRHSTKPTHPKKHYHCPHCQQEVEVPLKRTLSSNLFQKFAKLVNGLIQVGIEYPNECFQRDTLIAVKAFYNKISHDPQIKRLFAEVQLLNRLQRCAAQYAYYAIREYQRRGGIVALLAEMLSEAWSLSKDFVQVMTEEFPSRTLLSESRNRIKTTFPVYDDLSNVFLGNLWRHVRNLLHKKLAMEANHQQLAPFMELTLPKEIEQVLGTWLQANLDLFQTHFVRDLSRTLTQRVKKIRKKHTPLWGQGHLDSVIAEILEFNGESTISPQTWERYRRRWRQQTMARLQGTRELLNFDAFVRSTINDYKDLFNGNAIICQLLKPQLTGRSFRYKGDLQEDWKRFLAHQIKEELLKRLVKTYHPQLLATLQRQSQELSQDPWPWLTRPIFRKQAIPFGPDDNRAYKLYIGHEARKIWKSNDKWSNEIFVRLTVAPQQKVNFWLNTPNRFHALVAAGYRPAKPVLIKRTGGPLILAIPFEKSLTRKPRAATSDTRIVGVDLGLKTLATISVVEGLAPVGLKQKILPEKDLIQYFKEKKVETHEIGRYFLDQKQLARPVESWFIPAKSHPTTFCNFKQKLARLTQQAHKLRSQLDGYRNRHRPHYRRKKKYARLRREQKRLWQKIRRLHEEITRQIANRLVAVSVYHSVTVIRFEDLTWAQHEGKAVRGTWLATWQTHWFHGEIIRRTTEMALRQGVRVEQVDAWKTSQRCSSCGQLGQRLGKKFQCPHCAKPTPKRTVATRQLDSDLNAARNIAIAPLPLSQRRRRQAPVTA